MTAQLISSYRFLLNVHFVYIILAELARVGNVYAQLLVGFSDISPLCVNIEVKIAAIGTILLS